MNHENPIHLLADTLTDYFEGSNAVNYIEQTFTCNQDSSKSFVVTMQKIEGLTPCEKLSKAEKLNADMYEMLESACSELYSLINEVNKEMLSKVHSQTEAPPDLHDMETCHLIQQLLKRARGE